MSDSTKPADVEALARFELELADVYIRDIWVAVFGPDKPQPSNRNQALSRILACCCNVAWPHTLPAPTPQLRLLPVGFEPDGENEGL